MKTVAVAFIAAAALAVGVAIGATQLGDNNASGQNPDTVSPARSADSSAEAERVADCREDALSDRDSDDPKEALADDDCLGVSSDDGDATGDEDDNDP